MTSYRALLLAGTFVLGASAAYADDGMKDIQLRDEGLQGYNNEVYEPSAPLFTGRASAMEPPAAYEEGDPAAYDEGVDVEDTNRDVPQSLRKADKAYESNDN